ncbi:hypothetical protein H634G_09952 [Metarhizium anisopliae BRIP 53293]|uniref:Aflatoxin regulatory protein domain-containing protein n=1 Tax=Metarhizium anisopliae BRIP 53293 TaxID=1291518 RepID=A0A0D9NL86_METAN|nr:hypothetical protein H634G_09952 [Metarhizium anisopliae BRIP 53293]KJK88397.1 hypothetical protein H633G_07737 [Metarhizium anisopliae BRIP 53284]
MLRHSSYSTEGTPEEPQSLSSPDHSLSQENADFAPVEMEPEKGIEDREVILPPSPQSQLHSLPTLCGTTLGSLESDTRDTDTSSSERHFMPSHRPIALPAAEPDLHAGYLSTGQGLSSSGGQYEEDMQWQSILATNTPPPSDGHLVGFLSMPEWTISRELDSQWKDLSPSRRLDAADGDVEVGDTQPTSPSSAFHTSTCIDDLLIIQRDLYSLSESICTANTRQTVSKEAPRNRQSCAGNIEKMFSATESLMHVIHTMNRSDGNTCSQGSSACRCSSGADRDCRSESIPNTWRLADNSTVLLILSCYLRLLDMYESLAQFLRHSHQTGSPNSTVNAPGIPIFALGNFNLGTSPDANIGVILHMVLDMVDRLQTAVSHCAVKATGDLNWESETAFRRGHAGSWGAGSSSRPSGRAGYQVDEAHGCSTGRATETFLRAMLSDVRGHELGLIRNLQDLRRSIRGRWLGALPFT